MTSFENVFSFSSSFSKKYKVSFGGLEVVFYLRSLPDTIIH